MNRRGLLGLIGGIGAAATSGGASAVEESAKTAEKFSELIRPPGASEEFLSKCIRCFKCGEACPYDSIVFADDERGINYGTPYVMPRDTPCYLCQSKDSDILKESVLKGELKDVDADSLRCGEVCPTGALDEIPNDPETIEDTVEMGQSEIDRSRCLGWTQNICSRCYRVCPYADDAIELSPKDYDLNVPDGNISKEDLGEAIGRPDAYGFKPVVTDACIGCGICESECPYGNYTVGDYPVTLEIPDDAEPAAIQVTKRVKEL